MRRRGLAVQVLACYAVAVRPGDRFRRQRQKRSLGQLLPVANGRFKVGYSAAQAPFR